jgi:hypothetical protein
MIPALCINALWSLTQKAANETARYIERRHAGLEPGIRVLGSSAQGKTWMAGSSSAMTENDSFSSC